MKDYFDDDFWGLKINYMQSYLQDLWQSVKIIKESLTTFGKEFEALVKSLENFKGLYW